MVDHILSPLRVDPSHEPTFVKNCHQYHCTYLILVLGVYSAVEWRPRLHWDPCRICYQSTCYWVDLHAIWQSHHHKSFERSVPCHSLVVAVADEYRSILDYCFELRHFAALLRMYCHHCHHILPSPLHHQRLLCPYRRNHFDRCSFPHHDQYHRCQPQCNPPLLPHTPQYPHPPPPRHHHPTLTHHQYNLNYTPLLDLLQNQKRHQSHYCYHYFYCHHVDHDLEYLNQYQNQKSDIHKLLQSFQRE
mmetsp:Transcript_28813/g.49017  ORF Transcript_28813/g.49017 Transcript_28813/m.49017 type:complete len:246 (+) Transcript_28813:665-1402(+)